MVKEAHEHHLRYRLAEAHHDVAVIDHAGQVLARRWIDTGVKGFGELMATLVEHVEDPTAVPLAIETDKNLIVVALQAAELTIYPINPRAVARYRERHRQSGKKSDPVDLGGRSADRSFCASHTPAGPSEDSVRS